MLESKVGQELHAWLQDAAMAEEFFFATMARIDQKVYQATGAIVQGDSELISFSFLSCGVWGGVHSTMDSVLTSHPTAPFSVLGPANISQTLLYLR